MLTDIVKTDLFTAYYEQWIKVYKEGAVRQVTLNKYLMTLVWVKRLIPKVRLCDMSRIVYQQMLNDYAQEHERQTTMDFHHQLKGAVMDAVDDGLIDRDPMLMYGKEASNRKQEIDRQHYTIPNQRPKDKHCGKI